MSMQDTTADHLAIRMLVDQYSDAANSLDAHGMAAVYTEDAVLISFGSPFEGRAAIEKVFGETIGVMQLMNQVCSGGVITVDGDRATARWSVTEFAKREAQDKLELFLGNYEDELVRTAEGWLFSKRVLTRRMQCRFEAQLRF
jgi:ketosteroid isomerase-like protein